MSDKNAMELAPGYPIDLPALLESRLLIQAQSGGGKSWILRRLLEQTASSVQQLIIDPEGEFSTLREHFDYVIAAPRGADAVASPQTAALLARRLHESGVSAILDIYDLKAHERQLFVRRFLEALVSAPRALWHPVLVVVDEAHMFCPQSGSSEASAAVIDVATRGRKRGLCLVAATQRLSKLHKDAAAELLNKLIGRTALMIDVKRASDELGMIPREAVSILRNLNPGEFFGFGPALSRGVEKVAIGAVVSTHPKIGERLMQAPPPPSAHVMEQLAKLADLQREAEEEARAVDELRALNTELKRKLTIAEKRAEQAGVPEKEVERRIVAAIAAAPAKEILVPDQTDALLGALHKAGALAEQIVEIARRVPLDSEIMTGSSVVRIPAQKSVAAVSGDSINPAQQRILDVLAWLHLFGVDAPRKEMVAAHAGVSPTSGGYFNNLGKLRTMGFVDYPVGGSVALTVAGRAAANDPEKAPTLAELHSSWLNIVTAPQAAILRVVMDQHPRRLAKNWLADQVGVSRTSGGYFNNLGKLRSLGAIDYPERGAVAATALLFPVIEGVGA